MKLAGAYRTETRDLKKMVFFNMTFEKAGI